MGAKNNTEPRLGARSEALNFSEGFNWRPKNYGISPCLPSPEVIVRDDEEVYVFMPLADITRFPQTRDGVNSVQDELNRSIESLESLQPVLLHVLTTEEAEFYGTYLAEFLGDGEFDAHFPNLTYPGWEGHCLAVVDGHSRFKSNMLNCEKRELDQRQYPIRAIVRRLKGGITEFVNTQVAMNIHSRPDTLRDAISQTLAFLWNKRESPNLAVAAYSRMSGVSADRLREGMAFMALSPRVREVLTNKLLSYQFVISLARYAQVKKSILELESLMGISFNNMTSQNAEQIEGVSLPVETARSKADANEIDIKLRDEVASYVSIYLKEETKGAGPKAAKAQLDYAMASMRVILGKDSKDDRKKVSFQLVDEMFADTPEQTAAKMARSVAEGIKKLGLNGVRNVTSIVHELAKLIDLEDRFPDININLDPEVEYFIDELRKRRKAVAEQLDEGLRAVQIFAGGVATETYIDDNQGDLFAGV